MKQLYGAFVGTRWGMTYCRRRAIRATKKEMKRQGTSIGEVRAHDELGHAHFPCLFGSDMGE